MDDTLIIFLTIGGGALILFWVTNRFLVPLLSGWQTLSTRYGASGPAQGDSFSWATARFSWFANYGKCLNVTISSDGIHLQPFWLLRSGHKPLFFPWGAVKDLQQSNILFFYSTQIVIGSDGDDWTKTITFYGKMLADSLQKHAPVHLHKNA